MIGAFKNHVQRIVTRENIADVLKTQGETAAGNILEITNAMSLMVGTPHIWRKSLNLGSSLSLAVHALAAAGQANHKIALAAIIAQPFAQRASAAFAASKTIPKPPEREFLLRAIKKHPVTAAMFAATAAIGVGHNMTCSNHMNNNQIDDHKTP